MKKVDGHICRSRQNKVSLGQSLVCTEKPDELEVRTILRCVPRLHRQLLTGKQRWGLHWRSESSQYNCTKGKEAQFRQRAEHKLARARAYPQTPATQMSKEPEHKAGCSHAEVTQ